MKEEKRNNSHDFDTSVCRRIIITGTSGSGKTTLGHQISQILDIKCIDLDELYWLPGWIKREEEEFNTLIENELLNDRWIFCGNYTRAQQKLWSQADAIIWLDMPLHVCLWRAFKRSIRRVQKHESCCNGNYETFWRLLKRESILIWIWQTHSHRKKIYSEFFNNRKGIQTLIRLTSSRETNEFVKSL